MRQKGVVLFSDGSLQNGTTSNSQLPALEHVANRPIVHHVLDAMLAAGADELVVAGAADVLIDIRACLRPYEKRPLRLEYAVCEDHADAVAILRAALPVVGAAPCIVHVGDGLLDEPIAPHVEKLHDGSVDLVLLCQALSAAGASNGGTRQDTSVPGILCEAGIGVFGPGAFRDACEGAPATESCGLAVLAQQLSGDGKQVELCLADGWRRYRGDPHDLLELNRLALDLLVPQMRAVAAKENHIEGRVHIDATASVTTSVLVGPVVIGEGAEVTNAYLGPYTSIGAGARIEGVEIERSIISPGASVMHVGARLVSSLVGRGAQVFRDFSLPRALRLRVGEGDEVALC